MSDAHPPAPLPPSPYRPPPPPRGNGVLGCLFTLSVLVNVLALGAILFLGCFGFLSKGSLATETTLTPTEKFHSGSRTASSKIAIVSLDGVIMEGMLGFVHREIDQAARDSQVKAVVLRINSPGGTITASDDLHRRLVELRDGNPARKTNAKPLIVSMSSTAASGGYYVAMPSATLFAEPTTITGSIGVYASFPKLTGLAEKYGVHIDTIKQGELKNSGAMLTEMEPKEKLMWQDMVDHAYQDFLDVVEKGRPALKGKLLEPITLQPVNAGPARLHKEAPPKEYQRYRADGGVFTADRALKFGLIDKIGYLDDAIRAARDAANLGESYKAVEYKKHRGLVDILLGVQAPQRPANLLDPARLQAAFSPRLWFLAPGHDVAGLLTAAAAAQ